MSKYSVHITMFPDLLVYGGMKVKEESETFYHFLTANERVFESFVFF